MQYSIAAIVSLAMLLSLGSPAQLETIDFSGIDPGRQTAHKIKWPKRTIEVAFSASLGSPGPNIKPGSDVIGAARRALARWSSMANITLVETNSSAVSISSASGGDGTSLLTIADTPENEELFNIGSTTGRTRVFYDPETGVIAEADICLNPHPRSPDGTALQFSTDGSPNTYDLEATFVHEIGHLLGLDHSDVLASTMQAHQALNGTYGLTAFTGRTLSEDDRQHVRSLYGPGQHSARIEGRLVDNSSIGTTIPLGSVGVWAETASSGRVMASDVTTEDGSYQLEGLPPGQYRLFAESRNTDGSLSEVSTAASAAGSQRRFRSFELANQVVVRPDTIKTVNYNLVPPQNSLPALNPRLIGINGELSNTTVPLETGKRAKIYLGGEGIDQVPGTSISVSSPFFVVDPSSLAREQFATPFPVISFDVTVAANAPFGDYSIRVQSNSGETAYVPGAITIDPGATSQLSNPVDDLKFFVTQHYRDLVGRDPDHAGLDYWTTQFAPCGSRNDCIRARRIDISAALLLENELPSTSAFVYGLYTSALGRRPRFAEFESDRNMVLNRSSDPEAGRRALALAFVQRSEFQRRYPSAMKAKEFVNSLISSNPPATDNDPSLQRDPLIASYDGTDAGRAAVLTRTLASQAFSDAEYNQRFVLMQYFSYLRRDPDETGYNFWVNVLKSKPTRDPEAARAMVCAFLNSAEYQGRFGILVTHSSNECSN
ncbi:MAG: hypothetical protein QOH96_691 [Blastocatellia bacterium]|nr:hypothetical protein [Blastocatellia bacterium]